MKTSAGQQQKTFTPEQTRKEQAHKMHTQKEC
jgi:hypothetical protein